MFTKSNGYTSRCPDPETRTAVKNEYVVVSTFGNGHGVMIGLTTHNIVLESNVPMYNFTSVKKSSKCTLHDTLGVLEKLQGTTINLIYIYELQRPVRIIQRHWRRAIADPGYSICQKRLLYESADISTLGI